MSALRPAAKGGMILLGALVIAAAARVMVPMTPVPMTLQTWAVLVVAALGGRLIGTGAIAAYLLLGAVGLPVFAGGASGVSSLVGPTGGFLVGFLAIGFGVALAAERRWTRTPAALVALMLVAHLALFVPGVGWLAHHVGVDKAIAGGLEPFVLGAMVKAVLAALTVLAVERSTKPRDDAGEGEG